jgi:aminomethyltransferase
MRLYGSDIDETTTPLEADLAWTVGWQKDDFDKTIGAAALREQKAAGIRWKIVGFEMIDPGIARHGHSVHIGETGAPPAGLFGKVTSGTQTPYLKKAIGMAYLPVELAVPGAEFDVDIRGRRARGRVVPMPFYKREKQGGSD